MLEDGIVSAHCPKLMETLVCLPTPTYTLVKPVQQCAALRAAVGLISDAVQNPKLNVSMLL
jgi:hypothetical protein